MNHNGQKKAAVINDFSSFGRCSLAVAFPILSAMKVQCCAVPTALFTNHTGFPDFSWTDLSERMDDYIRDWRATGLSFSAITSGFLVSRFQIDFVRRFVETFRTSETIVVVDPVMGDYGKLYRTFKPEVAKEIRALAEVADYLTPNLTEACVLAGREYEPNPGDAVLADIAAAICRERTRGVVISGVPRGGELVNFVYRPGCGGETIVTDKIGPDRSGTGDVFAAVLTGALVGGCEFPAAVGKAVGFVSRCIHRAQRMDIPLTDGLPIEEELCELWS